MIRINLVRKERKKEKSEKSLQLAAGDMTQQLVFLGLFLITFAAMAFFWFDISGKKNTLESEVREAQAEKRRLEEIKILVDGLEAERNRLSQRFTVLNELKNNMRTPLYPIFFIYIAQQENPGVLIQEIKLERDEEGYVTATIRGEAGRQDFNAFVVTMQQEAIIAGVDILGTSEPSYNIRVNFIPFNQFGETATPLAEPIAD